MNKWPHKVRIDGDDEVKLISKCTPCPQDSIRVGSSGGNPLFGRPLPWTWPASKIEFEGALFEYNFTQ